jgi:hypothetical protein
MSHYINDIIFDQIRETVEIAEMAKDNLFSANHRNRMIEQHGFTTAQILTVEDLENDRK